MSNASEIAGQLSEKDVKRLASLTRASMVGPTATYYAGVTAPVISAGVAIFSRTAFLSVGLSDYWALLLSALLAAFAGIAWYLIFMRWSYRSTFGRGAELTETTQIEVLTDGLVVTRGDIRTQIAWNAVENVQRRRGYTAILVRGADAIVLPDRWFKGGKADRDAFLARLEAGGTP